jgi:hypothetical protein
MEQVFAFGQVTFGYTFTNRETEKQRLLNNIRGGIHTILISPRRWGKSSLIKQVGKEFNSKEIKFCYLDIFSIKDEHDFYRQYAEALIKASSSKLEDAVKNAGKYIKNLIPSFSVGNGIDANFEVKFRVDETKHSPEELINLAENIAKDKGIRLVVCLDEFQNINDFENGLAFQKKLRANWQHHSNVVYIIYGSKLSMMSDMFSKRKMPFYNFGDIFFLEKISKAHLVKFLIERFKQTGKHIDLVFAEQIIDLMECHPHYVQHLSHFVWYACDKKVVPVNLEDSMELLLNSYAPMFQRMFEDLSRIQVNYLKAIADGNITLLTSKDIVAKYEMGTPASVLKAIIGLEKKEILDRMNSKTEFLDPVFKIWFKKLFKIR